MSALGLSLIAFACIFGTTLLSMFVRSALPEHHLNSDSKDAMQCDTGAIPGATRVLACHYICKLQSFRTA
jgi:hypothetical protein